MPTPTQDKLYTFADLASATRKAYPGEFDDVDDQDLATAVHRAYPGEFNDSSNPVGGIELLPPSERPYIGGPPPVPKGQDIDLPPDVSAPKGLLEPGTINPNARRKPLRNPNGSISTVDSITIEADGQYVVIPTVVNGKRLTPQQAIEHWKSSPQGEDYGIFDTQANADAHAQAIHQLEAWKLQQQRQQTAGLGPPPKPTATMLGTEGYQPSGPALSSIESGMNLPSDLGMQAYDALTQAVTGRQAQVSDVLHPLGAGARASYGYTQALKKDIETGGAAGLDPSLVAVEEAQRGTMDYGELARQAVEPALRYAGEQMKPFDPVMGWNIENVAPQAVAMGVAALTDPTSYLTVGSVKAGANFPRYLAGWATGKNAERAMIREGLDRLAAELPEVEARAAFPAGAWQDFRGGPLYERIARDTNLPTVDLSVPRGTVAPPPAPLGPERQIQPRRIYGLEPGQSIEPGTNPAVDRVGPEPPPPVGDQPLYTEPPPDYVNEPTINALGDQLGTQLERQPIAPGRLTGKAGYRLKPPPVPETVQEASTTARQGELFRGRRRVPQVEGRVELRGHEEAPYSGSQPGQEAIPTLREPIAPELFSTQAHEAAHAPIPERAPADWREQVDLGTPEAKAYQQSDEFYRYFDTAVANGYEGDEQHFADLFADANRNAETLGREALKNPDLRPRTKYDDGIEFLQAIADEGGLHYDPKAPERGELEQIFGHTNGVIKGKGGKLRLAPEGRIAGVKGAVIRHYRQVNKTLEGAMRASGKKIPKSLDDMAEALHARGLLEGHDQNELLDRLFNEVLPAVQDGPPKRPNALKYGMDYLDIRPGGDWWNPQLARWDHPESIRGNTVPFDIPEGELSSEDLARAMREAPGQVGPPPDVGQPPLGAGETPRYDWRGQLKKFLSDEEGSVQLPSDEEWDRIKADARMHLRGLADRDPVKLVSKLLRGTEGDRVFEMIVGDRLGELKGRLSPFQIASSLDHNAKPKYAPQAREIGNVLLDALDHEDVPIPKADLLDTGEEQPRLPGDVGAVRDQEVPTPQEELPFSLEREVPKEKPRTTPSLFDFFTDEKGEVDFDQLRESLGSMARTSPETIGKWLKANKKVFGNEEWFQRARQLVNEGKPYEAHREVLLAQRQIAKEAAAISAREIGGRDRQAARATAADLRSQAKDVLNAEQPPWANPGVKEEKIVPSQYAGTEEEGIPVMRPPLRGPLPDPAIVDRTIGVNTVREILDVGSEAGVFDNLRQPYSIVRQEPWRRETKLRLYRQIADRLLRQESLPELRIMHGQGVAPLEQVARWWTAKFSEAGRTLGMLGNWQRNAMADGTLKKLWVEPHFEGLRGGAPEPGEFEAIADAARTTGTTGRDLAAEQGRKAPTPSLIGETAVDYLSKDLAWGKTGGAGQYTPGKPKGTFNAVENLTRALITSQLPTAIRNLWTGMGRYAVGAVDESLAGLLAHLHGDPEAGAAHWALAKRLMESPFASGTGATRPWTDTLEAMYQFSADALTDAKGNPLKARDARRSLAVLEQFSRNQKVAQTIALDYLGDMAGEAETAAVTTGGKLKQKILSPQVRNVISVFNRAQEFAVRGATFDATFRAELDRMGFDTDKLLTHDFADIVKEVGPEKLQDALTAATHQALNYTFAAGAYPGSLPDHLLKFFGSHPLFRTGYPFPRFNLVSGPRMIYDHSPMALFDLVPMAARKLGLIETPMGRLAKGVAAKHLQMEALPRMLRQEQGINAGLEAAWSEFKARTLQSRALAKEFRNLERQQLRAEAGGLPSLGGEKFPMSDRLTEIGEQLGALEEAKINARAKVTERTQQLRQLQSEMRQVRKTIGNAQKINAPDWDRWMAAQMSGLGMLGAAWVVRSSPGAKGTEWYQYRVKFPSAMGGSEHLLDFRVAAPFAQYLFVADALEDMRTHVDWNQFHNILTNKDEENDRQYNFANPFDVYDAMRQSYDGKYLADNKFANDFTSAFLSMSRAAGTTQTLIDLFTGQASGDMPEKLYKTLVGGVGQFLARFTTPMRQFADLASAVRPEEGTARIPREDTTTHLFTDPIIANIPGLRETIPEKISTTTGGPITSDLAALRPLSGITTQAKDPIAAKFSELGLKFSNATPKQTGNRELDNKIATAYHARLMQVWPTLNTDETIQALPIGKQREVYQSVLTALKSAAYGQVASDLSDEGQSAEQVQRTLKPADARKRQYMLRMVRKLQAEEPGPAEEPGVEGPPPLTFGNEGDEAPDANEPDNEYPNQPDWHPQH